MPEKHDQKSHWKRLFRLVYDWEGRTTSTIFPLKPVILFIKIVLFFIVNSTTEYENYGFIENCTIDKK